MPSRDLARLREAKPGAALSESLAADAPVIGADAALLEQVHEPLVAGAPLGDTLVHDAQAARGGVGRVATAGTFASRGRRTAAEAERRLYGDLGSPIDTRLDIVLHRRLSRPVSRTAVALGISPNAITIASGIVGLMRRRCRRAWATPAALIGGLLLYVLAVVVLDHADGEVARLTLTESALGEWLDVVVDTVVHTTLMLALGRRRHAGSPARATHRRRRRGRHRASARSSASSGPRPRPPRRASLLDRLTSRDGFYTMLSLFVVLRTVAPDPAARPHRGGGRQLARLLGRESLVLIVGRG